MELQISKKYGKKGQKKSIVLLFLKNIDKQMEKFILNIYLIIWNNCENTLFLYALKMLRRVAQPGSALRSGRRGRWFESSRADKYKPLIFKGFFVLMNEMDKCNCVETAHSCGYYFANTTRKPKLLFLSSK